MEYNSWALFVAAIVLHFRIFYSPTDCFSFLFGNILLFRSRWMPMCRMRIDCVIVCCWNCKYFGFAYFLVVYEAYVCLLFTIRVCFRVSVVYRLVITRTQLHDDVTCYTHTCEIDFVDDCVHFALFVISNVPWHDSHSKLFWTFSGFRRRARLLLMAEKIVVQKAHTRRPK